MAGNESIQITIINNTFKNVRFHFDNSKSSVNIERNLFIRSSLNIEKGTDNRDNPIVIENNTFGANLQRPLVKVCNTKNISFNRIIFENSQTATNEGISEGIMCNSGQLELNDIIFKNVKFTFLLHLFNCSVEMSNVSMLENALLYHEFRAVKKESFKLIVIDQNSSIKIENTTVNIKGGIDINEASSFVIKNSVFTTYRSRNKHGEEISDEDEKEDNRLIGVSVTRNSSLLIENTLCEIEGTVKALFDATIQIKSSRFPACRSFVPERAENFNDVTKNNHSKDTAEASSVVITKCISFVVESGSSVVMANSTFTVESSRFITSKCISFVIARRANATISNSTFTKCVSFSDKYKPYTTRENSSLVITNTTFIELASFKYFGKSNIVIADSTFTNVLLYYGGNSSILVENSTFTGCVNFDIGKSSTFEITNCLFIECIDFYVGGNSYTVITNSTFTKSISFSPRQNSNFVIKTSTFAECISLNGLSGASAVITDSLFTEHTPRGNFSTVTKKPRFTECIAYNAINASFVIANSTFAKCISLVAYGNSSIFIANSTFTECTSIYASRKSSFVITNSTFTGCTSFRVNQISSVVIKNSKFSESPSSISNGTYFEETDLIDGRHSLCEGSIFIFFVNIWNCTCAKSVIINISEKSLLLIEDTMFLSGVNIKASVSSNVEIRNYESKLFGSDSEEDALLIDVTRSKLSIENTLLQQGGNIRAASSSTVEIRNSTLIGYRSFKSDGNIKFNAHTEINGVTYTAQIEISQNSSLLIESTLFRNNSCKFDGGTVKAYIISSVVLVNSTFIENKSFGSDGGAIFIGQRSKMTSENCTFSGNTAAMDGGAIMVSDNSTYHDSGSLFFNNTASNYGE